MAQEYEIGFFGINQLGAAKPCAEGLYGALNLSIFDDEEYLLAFDKFDRDGNGFLDKDEIHLMLEDVMNPTGRRNQAKAPAPQEAVDEFMEHFDGNSDGKISRQEFQDGLASLKEKSAASTKRANGRTHKSYNAYKGQLNKHTREKEAPTNRMVFAQTTSEGYGYDPEVGEADAPVDPARTKTSCAETLYADKMVKSGVYY